MTRDHRTSRNINSLGISISLLFCCVHAWAGEGKKTKPVVQPHSQLRGEPSSSALGQANPADASSGWVQDVKKGVVHGFTKVFKDWRNPLGADLPSDPASAIAATVQKVTLGENVILKKIATEEYALIEGTTVQPSRSTTLQRGVSLSRAVELLGEVGIDLTAVRAEIGVRLSDMLGDELPEATTTGTLVAIDGNVWEKARIDWYARIRSGKVILKAGGVTHELPFEYTVGFEPKVTGSPRRRPDGSRNNGAGAPPGETLRSPVDPSLRKVARVTTVSAYSPDLFEARSETTPAVVQGDKLAVFRGDVTTRCMGYCEVVAIRGSRIVGRCDGFRPKVGDFVSQTGVAHGLNQTRR